MQKILWALAWGLGGGVLFFAMMTLLASLVPSIKNDPLIFGVGAVMLGLLVMVSILFRK